MNRKTLIGILIVAAALVAPFGTAVPSPEESLYRAIYDDNGELVWEQYVDPGNPLLLRTDHYLRLGGMEPTNDEAKPGSGGSDPGTDCESDAYKLTGHYWTEAWSAKSSDYASILSGAANLWDQQAGGVSIAGGIQSGNDGTAGVQDFKNNIQWVNLGGGSTVAVTSTWSYIASGIAVESDARYNTAYPWATNGAGNAMDVGHVGTHEIGHTFGLGHPSGSGIACLTMYAYVNYGQTHGRTLGDGDILGIKAIYG